LSGREISVTFLGLVEKRKDYETIELRLITQAEGGAAALHHFLFRGTAGSFMPSWVNIPKEEIAERLGLKKRLGGIAGRSLLSTRMGRDTWQIKDDYGSIGGTCQSVCGQSVWGREITVTVLSQVR